MKRYHALTISDLRQETQDAVSIAFALPDELRQEFRYVQGQHLNIKALIDGEEVRRSYSICSGVDEQELRIAIKRVPEGKFSTFANERLAVGETLEVMAPQGHFYTELDADSEREYLAVAAGSGITPILSILKTTLTREPQSRFTLLYGNRTTLSTLFREELEDLKNRYLARLNLVYIMSREEQELELFNGRISGEKCRQLLRHWIHPSQLHACFLCGPQSMTEEVAAAFQAEGIDKTRIHVELFSTYISDLDHQHHSDSKDHAVSDVSITIDGRTLAFELTRNSESILDAGLAAGADLPWSCRSGVCSTCRAKLIEGDVEMDSNFALEPSDVDAGYVLTCQCYPVSDKVVLDYDR